MLPTTSAVSVGLIGFGLSGSVFHAPLIENHPGFTLAAVATDNPDHQAKVRRAFPRATLHTSAEALFEAADGLGLIVVSATNNLHVPYARAAMDAGVPVLVEKPLAPSADEAAALVAEAEARSAFLTVFQNRRFDGDFLTVRDVVATGELGGVCRYESRFQVWAPQVTDGWRDRPEPGLAGGVLFDLGTHLVDQAVMLFGTVETVYAELALRRPGARIDDDSFISLLFANGVRAHLSATMIAATPEPRFLVAGSRGTFVSHGLDPQEAQLGAGLQPSDPGYGLADPPASGTIVTEQGQRRIPLRAGRYLDFYDQLHDALAGVGPIPVAPSEAVYVLRVLEAARRSALEGVVVRLD
jgi:predicted dehydrogenase